MAEYVSSLFPRPIELKFEKVYWPCVLESKKRYCGYPWEDGDVKPRFEAKGLETVRRDGTTASSKILKHTAVTLFDMTLCGRVNLAKLKHIVLAELKKIKSHPAQFLSDFILEKGFRGVEGYSAHSRIPTLKIAKIRFSRDPKGGPHGGSRVKYAIAATGGKSDSVYAKVEEVDQFIFGDKLIDVDYYIQVHT